MRTVSLLMTSFTFSVVCCGVSFAAPQFTLGSVTLPPGGTGVLPLSVSGGTEAFAGLNARIVLPPDVYCEGLSQGSALSGSFVVDHRKTPGAQETITVLAYSGTDTFSNGEVLIFALRADNNAEPGTYAVVFSDAKAEVTVNSKWALSNATGSNSILGLVVESGTITLHTDPNNGRAYGDFDNDGFVDANDFLLLLDNWQNPYDANDFLALLDHWQQSVKSIPVALKADAQASLTAASTAMTVGDTVTVTLEVNTNGAEVRGGAFTIDYDPAIFEIVDGVAGVSKPETSPFNLSPPATLDAVQGKLGIQLLEPAFATVTYAGPIAEFTVRALAESSGSALTFISPSRFSPETTGMMLNDITLIVSEASTSGGVAWLTTAQPVLPGVDSTTTVAVHVDTVENLVRGGAFTLVYDSQILEIVGGAGGVTKPATSPFNLSPPATLDAAQGKLGIQLLEPAFSTIAYAGPVAEFTVRALSETSGTVIDFVDPSRFSPETAGIRLDSLQLVVTDTDCYVLTVIKGAVVTPQNCTGGYSSGTVVTIHADPPDSGKDFDQWAGDVDTVANVLQETTTITMNANKTVTATYKISTPSQCPADLAGLYLVDGEYDGTSEQFYFSLDDDGTYAYGFVDGHTSGGSGEWTYTSKPECWLSLTGDIALSGPVTASTTGFEWVPEPLGATWLWTPLVDLSVMPDSREVGSEAGTTTFDVTTTASWIAASGASWATVTPASGMGNATLTVAYEANIGLKRSAAVTVTGNGTIPELITVDISQAVGRSCTEAPAAPENLQAVTVTYVSGQINLTWEPSEEATGYQVYRRIVGSADAFEKIGVSIVPSYSDTNAPTGYDDNTPMNCLSSTFDCMGCISSESNPGCYASGHILGDAVEYQVTAVNECGESDPSNIATAAAWKKLKFLMATIGNSDMLLFLGVAVALLVISRKFRATGSMRKSTH
jgi:hypothetical protein